MNPQPTARIEAGGAELVLDDARYPAIWLRDNCPCADCALPGSGQKLFGITDLPSPAELTIVEAAYGSGEVSVRFAPGGHTSRFAESWLRAHRLGANLPYDDRAEDAKVLWNRATFASADSLPGASFAQFARDESTRLGCLDALLTYGFFLLHDVAVRERAVLEVAETFGYVRETNYGSLFDVRVEQNPANLAFSSLPITPHTDNPYRDPVPTIQLLHCLANAAGGGESGLVDGFEAAAALREQNPDAFDLLARTPVTFRYADESADLAATNPMIDVDVLGRIKGIRFNNRSMRPLTGRLPVERVAEFYQAYRAFAELLYRPGAQLNFRLEPGDCVVFDNTRTLHARTGFTAGGHRHLQGCYADLDAAASARSILRRARAEAAQGSKSS
ncbi:2-trimethylaminoethylphosphonate dioxygenase [Actinospica robiniae]|uniref:2-trimethylaminoethylphosphonate dioxygenase n=1 Tax=Actinospica robiniae TaxID=304901 RepID=UPI000414E551|nr:TauD/TfdA family dioxygenase [Actinospica robiniae]